MRIAMIGTRGLPATHGGVERAVEALSRRLVKRGHDVTVYGRRGYCDTRCTEFDGVRQIALPAVRTKHLEAILHTALATAHACSVGQYDILHFHATGPALLSPFARLRGVPSVVTVQGLDWKREKWGLGARMVLRAAAYVAAHVPDETIVVSQELKRTFSDSYRTEATYIPNGVEVSELDISAKPVDGLESRKFVLFLGRLVPEKQPLLLIEAFRRVETDHKLVIAGPALYADDYLAELRQAAQHDERVVLTGPKYGGEKAWLLQNARLFVQPSTLEGLPIALLEALVVGTPVAVSDIPANLEVIVHRKDARSHIFRARDAADLRDVLQDVLSADTEPRAKRSAAAVSSFDWEAIAARTEAIYDRALGSQPVASEPRSKPSAETRTPDSQNVPVKH